MKITHPSHNLKFYGGVLLCVKCGYVGRLKLHKLAELCQKPKGCGVNNLRLYKLGKPPAGCPGWPYPTLQLLRTVEEGKAKQDLINKIDTMRRSVQDQQNAARGQDDEVDSVHSVNSGDTSSD